MVQEGFVHQVNPWKATDAWGKARGSITSGGGPRPAFMRSAVSVLLLYVPHLRSFADLGLQVDALALSCEDFLLFL